MRDKGIIRILKYNFGFPVTINWGYSLFLCAIGTMIVYLLRSFAYSSGILPSLSSLIGYSLTEPLLIIFALLLPACSLFIERKKHPLNIIVDSVGRYSGLGSIILAALSGISIMLIRIPLHNFFAWFWLRLGRTPIFPAFFFVNDSNDKTDIILGYITGTAIPAFGIALFFTGLLWACFSEHDRRRAFLIIPLSCAVFSLNFTDFLPIFIVTAWLCFLRDRVGTVWAPFLALLCSGLSEIFIRPFLKSVDITMVQVYSDIDSTYLYSSAPAFLVGLVLLAFFAKTLNDFSESYNADFIIKDENPDDKPKFTQGLNLALIVAMVIFAILWIIMLKGEKA